MNSVRFKQLLTSTLLAFENSRTRSIAIGISLFLHLAFISVNMVNEQTDESFATGLGLAAAVSLFPIVLCAESLKKMFLYIVVAISPGPILIMFIMLTIAILRVADQGIKSLDGSLFVASVTTTLGMAFLSIMVGGQYLLIPLVLRWLLRHWLTKGERFRT